MVGRSCSLDASTHLSPIDVGLQLYEHSPYLIGHDREAFVACGSKEPQAFSQVQLAYQLASRPDLRSVGSVRVPLGCFVRILQRCWN